MKRLFKKRRKLKIALLSFLVLVITLGLVANWYVKKKGYRNLWHYVNEAGSNYNKSRSARFETLSIKINEADFSRLENIREKALERGILISEDGNWVDATLKWNKQKIKAKLRLKGHMLDHLGENKWSFRVKTKGNDAFMGMKVFSLQEPGTRNYIYEWIYHQMMKQEGIVALHYDFIKLKVNGEDWGVYAVEEHFGQELIQHNQRVKGPIVRFDPEMYWKYRINELKQVNIHETSAEFRSAFVDAYDNSTLLEDSALLQRYARCAQLIQALREGKARTSDVFDIDKLAKFHAIIDLVGGHHSLDWSDVKYYYNAESDLLEPVAYESFSVNPTVQLAGAFKFNTRSPNFENWSTILFSDVKFFEKYVYYLKKYSQKNWLKAFFDKHQEELDNKFAILYKDYYSKQLPLDQYYANQKNIQALLESPKGFIAYLAGTGTDSVFLDISGIDALPYQIDGIKINDTVFPAGKTVNPRSMNGSLSFERMAFGVPAPVIKQITPQTKIKLSAHILGNDKKIDHPVIMVPSPDITGYTTHAAYTPLEKIGCIEINRADSMVLFKKGSYEVSDFIYIPAGYKVRILAGTRLRFKNGAAIQTYSPLLVNGNEDEPVVFESADSISGNISILNTGENTAEFRYAVFLNKGRTKDIEMSSDLRFYQSSFLVDNCYFAGSINDAMRISSSSGEISGSTFNATKRNAINVQYSTISLKNVNIKGGKTGLYLRGGKVVAISVNITGTDCGIKLTEMSYAQLKDINLTKNASGMDCSEKSRADVTNVVATENTLVFKVHKNNDVYGPAQVNVRGFKSVKNATVSEVGKKSVLNFVENNKE